MDPEDAIPAQLTLTLNYTIYCLQVLEPAKLEAFQSWGISSRRAQPRAREHYHFGIRLLTHHSTDRRSDYIFEELG